jgi:hypothetical protein
MDRAGPAAHAVGGLEQEDREIRPKQLQLPGRGHTGCAGADHGNVDLAASPGFDGHSNSFSPGHRRVIQPRDLVM